MAAEPQGSPMEGVPRTPGIREVRPDPDNFGICTESSRDMNPGIRRVSLRAEIDTSPPFGSVKEAVTRFGGSGPWVPLYKFGEACNGTEEFDIKKVEEQATELEKDLIVKELETLDVLEELGTTKKVVEELKRQLQNEALKCMHLDEHNMPSSPAIKEMNKEHCEQMGNSMPCPIPSPDLILMELKQAKFNLGKTMNDLGVIQTCVESLNKKMKKEKSLLEMDLERLTCKFARVKVKEAANHGSFENCSNILRSPFRNDSKIEQLKKMEVPRSMMPMTGNEQNRSYNTIAELRWIAAKKMEEAARAAEALALIEMKGLSSNKYSSGISLAEPERLPPTIHAMHKFAEANISKLSILRKLEQASDEVKHSKQALEEAINKVETANRKQLDVEEAVRRWINPEQEQKKQVIYDATKIKHQHLARSPLHELMKKQNQRTDDEPKPVLRPALSMRDVLRKKQHVTPEDCVVKRPNLSQMLHELRDDHVTFPNLHDDHRKEHGDDQKQSLTQRRKFGFIHILAKQNKKKP